MGFLLILLVLGMGILARSNLVVIAAVVLLVLRVLHLQGVFKLLADRGIDAGLLLLVITVLIPLATDQVTVADLKNTFLSPMGLMALAGGLLATKMNGMGIDLLKVEPQLVIGMVIGSVVGIVFWGGVPVGPLMAGGLTALFIKILSLF